MPIELSGGSIRLMSNFAIYDGHGIRIDNWNTWEEENDPSSIAWKFRHDVVDHVAVGWDVDLAEHRETTISGILKEWDEDLLGRLTTAEEQLQDKPAEELDRFFDSIKVV